MGQAEQIMVTLEPAGARPATLVLAVAGLGVVLATQGLGRVLVSVLFYGGPIVAVQPGIGAPVQLERRDEFDGSPFGPLLRLVNERTKIGFDTMHAVP